MKALDIVKKPILSEKSVGLTEKGIYCFEVNKDSKKPEISQAVEALFGVKVASVRTTIVHGEYKRFARGVVKLPNWKKAFVQLEAGQKIELFPSV